MQSFLRVCFPRLSPSSYEDIRLDEACPKDLILTYPPPYRPYIQLQSHSEVLEYRASTYDFRRGRSLLVTVFSLRFVRNCSMCTINTS